MKTTLLDDILKAYSPIYFHATDSVSNGDGVRIQFGAVEFNGRTTAEALGKLEAFYERPEEKRSLVLCRECDGIGLSTIRGEILCLGCGGTGEAP